MILVKFVLPEYGFINQKLVDLWYFLSILMEKYESYPVSCSFFLVDSNQKLKT